MPSPFCCVHCSSVIAAAWWSAWSGGSASSYQPAHRAWHGMFRLLTATLTHCKAASHSSLRGPSAVCTCPRKLTEASGRLCCPWCFSQGSGFPKTNPPLTAATAALANISITLACCLSNWGTVEVQSCLPSSAQQDCAQGLSSSVVVLCKLVAVRLQLAVSPHLPCLLGFQWPTVCCCKPSVHLSPALFGGCGAPWLGPDSPIASRCSYWYWYCCRVVCLHAAGWMRCTCCCRRL